MSKSKKKDAAASIGFGYVPSETQHHFMVVIPQGKNETVKVYERFIWQEGKEAQDIDENSPLHNQLKVIVPKWLWQRVAPYIAQEFNFRLEKEGFKKSKWKVGQNPVHRLLGKELVVLLWALEDCTDDSQVPVAIVNWQGLRPEERWWLYGVTNAATGRVNDRKGWRMALKYALLDNPVSQKQIKQLDFESIKEQKVIYEE
ncbi:DUF3780 domain-containing protein [Caldicellulosiruptor bescii]|uniref:DUF3780 domain-containing protein n=2 Tax=Caldicellulosiruptor bescii TaxID=31899 RepID=B9MK37_CALBD|nr:DUF3780 domain-containing protein [Caldicellulosiruptor bescii]ACM60695.1 conserved hypothetical protein [Caldicellulosiruptor bescii DSM 6725]SKC43957.1 Protein of unknown function [Caldicellulosiruptor bescii]SKC55237.1 Protein of unknown function [Caldicellulosiruptor bescii]SKC57559.1 Protein of unknown function [Caldicellulosiruptor bescii]SLL38394.1 Protein of unknown function [Caldicellulosiruptor bescii]